MLLNNHFQYKFGTSSIYLEKKCALTPLPTFFSYNIKNSCHRMRTYKPLHLAVSPKLHKNVKKYLSDEILNCLLCNQFQRRALAWQLNIFPSLKHILNHLTLGHKVKNRYTIGYLFIMLTLLRFKILCTYMFTEIWLKKANM